MTRRVIVPTREDGVITGPAAEPGHAIESSGGGRGFRANRIECRAPAYQPGETIGIAEPWFAQRRFNHLSGKKLAERRYKYEDFALHYLADGPKPWGFGRYRQARYLPDAFVRTKVRILEVRVERLHNISEEDAKAEGVAPLPSAHIAAMVAGDTPHRMEFYALWESIHGKGAWDRNEWTFVYRFELVTTPPANE